MEFAPSYGVLRRAGYEAFLRFRRNLSKHKNRKMNRLKLDFFDRFGQNPTSDDVFLLDQMWVEQYNQGPQQETIYLVNKMLLLRRDISKFVQWKILSRLRKLLHQIFGQWGVPRFSSSPDNICAELRKVLILRSRERRSIHHCNACLKTRSRDGDAALAIAMRFANLF